MTTAMSDDAIRALEIANRIAEAWGLPPLPRSRYGHPLPSRRAITDRIACEVFATDFYCVAQVRLRVLVNGEAWGYLRLPMDGSWVICLTPHNLRDDEVDAVTRELFRAADAVTDGLIMARLRAHEHWWPLRWIWPDGPWPDGETDDDDGA